MNTLILMDSSFPSTHKPRPQISVEYYNHHFEGMTVVSVVSCSGQ